MVKVSVIVPVYNVEIYLRKCLNSLVRQTLKEIEIILVNDGSTDSSPKICREYAKRFRNIKYISQDNQGLSGARNTGIKHAVGEYVGFVDSDDYVEDDMFEFLYRKAREHNVDISACGYVMFYENGKKKKCDVRDIKKLFSRDEALGLYLLPGYFDLITCNKLYKRELFNNVEFPIGIVFEDVPTVYKLIANSNGLYYDSKVKYNYLQRDNSLSRVIAERDLNRQILYVDEYVKLCECVMKTKPELAYLGRIRWLLVIFDKKLRAKKFDVRLMKKIKKYMRLQLASVLFSDKLLLKEKVKFWLFFISSRFYSWIYIIFKVHKG